MQEEFGKEDNKSLHPILCPDASRRTFCYVAVRNNIIFTNMIAYMQTYQLKTDYGTLQHPFNVIYLILVYRLPTMHQMRDLTSSFMQCIETTQRFEGEYTLYSGCMYID